MLTVAIAGFGFMGRMHYQCWKGLADARVVAICDANPNIVADTNKAIGNIEGAAAAVDFGELELYTDFSKMLAQQELDAVSIALPTYMHSEYSQMALKSGVNVLCEKPMALNAADCRQMIRAAQISGKVLQIGHCVRFWPEYAKAKEIVTSGEFGRVIAATFQRLGAAPGWAWDNWFMDEQRSGGMVLDLHIHDTDYVQYLFGVPHALCSHAAQGPHGGTAHIVTKYLYDDDKVVTAEGSWAVMESFGFEMSFNIMLEKATIVYDCTRQPAFRVCPAQGKAFTPEVAKGDGYSLEIAHFARVLSGEKVPQVTTLEQSLNSVRIVEAEKEAARKGSKVSLT
jgi:predicted dehydrogenase